MNFSLKSLCMALMLLHCNSIFAQISETTIKEVEGLETIYVTAVDGYNSTGITGLNLSLKETPQSITVINQDLLKSLNLNDLEQSLAYTTGVNVNVDSGRTRFQSRGFYIDNIQEDGVSNSISTSIFGPYGHSKEISDMAFYSHAEVLRGVAGLAQSNGNPSGTVNLVRKKPTEEFQANGSLTVGRWNEFRNMADVSIPLNDRVRTRFVGVWADKDSFKEVVNSERQGAMGTLEADLTEDTLLNVGVIYQKDEGVLDNYGLPVYQTDGTTKTLINLPRSTYLGLDWSGQSYEKTNAFAELKHQFNDDWQLSTKVNYTKSHGDIRIGALGGVNPYNEATNTHTLRQLRYTNSSDELAGKIDLTGKVQLFNRQHDIFANLSVSKEKFSERDRWLSNLTGQSIYNFNRNIAEPDWTDSSNLQQDRSYYVDVNQYAGVLGGRFNLYNNVYLLTGGRYSNVQYKRWNYNHKTDVFSSTTEIEKHKVTPYVGVTWDIYPHHTLYSSYTEIFKPQNARNKQGEFIEPLVGSNLETGIKSEWLNGRLNSTFALFQLIQKNRALTDPTDNNYSIADGTVRTRGFDFEIMGNLTDQWNLNAGYTYSKSIYMESENQGTGATDYRKGQSANLYTPKHMIRLYTSYTLPNQWHKWTVGTALRYQSETGSIYRDTVSYVAPKQSTYTLWDASLNYKVNDFINIGASIRNITDKTYFMNTHNRVAGMNNFYGEPRNYSLSLNWTY